MTNKKNYIKQEKIFENVNNFQIPYTYSFLLKKLHPHKNHRNHHHWATFLIKKKSFLILFVFFFEMNEF